MDEVYDEIEELGIKYSAHEVSQAVKGINWKINEEDIPYCIAGLLRNKVQLSNVQLITYDEGEFTEWLENEQSEFDGGYQVVDHAGTTRYFGWNYGSMRTQELYIQKKTTFTTRKPMTESKKPVKKALKEGGPRRSFVWADYSELYDIDKMAKIENDLTNQIGDFNFIVDREGDGKIALCAGNPIDDESWLKAKTIFKTAYREARLPRAKESKLSEGVGGCFYVIHESPIGHRGDQGWIDEYGELTSDPDSAEHYETLQEAVDMLYAIEDYVENFNDGEGIRATIQCVNPDADQVVGDVAVVDIQNCCGEVYCEVVLGEQNLINCGYLVEDSGPSKGYNQ